MAGTDPPGFSPREVPAHRFAASLRQLMEHGGVLLAMRLPAKAAEVGVLIKSCERSWPGCMLIETDRPDLVVVVDPAKSELDVAE